MPCNSPLLPASQQRSDVLGQEITELFGLITAATYDLLVRIRQFDQEQLWHLEGVCSCAHWLNWKCGIGLNAAREKVRVANALGELPKISEAFRLGKVSYSKVRAMTRVANAENEDYLLNIAKYGTAFHVESLVRGYRRAKQLNEVDSANQQHHARSLSYRYDDDGSLVIKGRLPAEVGAMLIKALDKAVERAANEVDEESDKDENETTAQDRPSFATRRADALMEMAESYLQQGPESSSSADRYQVMVHVNAATLTDDVTAETPQPDTAFVEEGPHVSAETSRRICCDTSISRLLENKKGEPISIGRKSRVIPPPMRRALRARDKGCRFPGCTHTYFIDGHHIQHWSRGGTTSLDNLVLLCRHHHRLVHEGGFACEKGETGDVVFRSQSGRIIHRSGFEAPANLEGFVHRMKEKLEERHIDSQTCVTEWRGEKMDRALAVEHIWWIDHRGQTTREIAAGPRLGHPVRRDISTSMYKKPLLT